MELHPEHAAWCESGDLVDSPTADLPKTERRAGQRNTALERTRQRNPTAELHRGPGFERDRSPQRCCIGAVLHCSAFRCCEHGTNIQACAQRHTHPTPTRHDVRAHAHAARRELKTCSRIHVAGQRRATRGSVLRAQSGVHAFDSDEWSQLE